MDKFETSIRTIRDGNKTGRQAKVAIVREKGGPFLIEVANIGDPRPDEVLVRVVATGVCHTDVIIRDQYYATPLPIVLGHEGSGVVEAIGSSVTSVNPGDHVVMTFLSCGHCSPCQQAHSSYCENSFALNFGGSRLDGSRSTIDSSGLALHDHFFGQSSFGSFAIASERNVVKVTKEAPLELLGPLGCGVQTGAGAVLNALSVRAGSSFAAFGAGTVGLSAIMAARIAGAKMIVAVDVVPSRLQLALELGATHVINSTDEDAVTTIRNLTGKGVDYSLESTGRPVVLRQAIDALGIRGTCGVVGASPMGTEASFDINMQMIFGRTVRGVIEGDAIPQIFIPTLVNFYLQDRFPFDKIVKYYAFEDINDAIRDSEAGTAIKPILRFN